MPCQHARIDVVTAAGAVTDIDSHIAAFIETRDVVRGNGTAAAEQDGRDDPSTKTNAPAHFLKPRGVFDLVEPVETHFAHDAVADDDKPRFFCRTRVEVLMRGEGRKIDKIAPRPFKALGLRLPIPLE